jgi:hypothetical protein
MVSPVRGPDFSIQSDKFDKATGKVQDLIFYGPMKALSGPYEANKRGIHSLGSPLLLDHG